MTLTISVRLAVAWALASVPFDILHSGGDVVTIMLHKVA